MKKLILPSASFTVLFIIALSLGFWQLARKDWKEGLLNDLARTQTQGFQALPHSLDPSKHLFMKVQVKGNFLNDKETYLFTTMSAPQKGIGGQGYLVFTPFELEQGGIILVNRGFIQKEQRLTAVKLEGTQDIQGVVRFNEKPSFFAAKDDDKNHIFYHRNSTKMLASRGLTGLEAFVDLTQSSVEKPLAGAIQPSLPNKHLEYSLTWFALALTLLVIYLLYMKRNLK